MQNNIIYANARGAVSLPITQRLSSDNTCLGNFYWSATEEPQFELQRGVMAPERMVERIEQALDAHSISPHQAPMLDLRKSGRYHPTVGEMVHNGPLVGLPLWKKMQGFDLDAVVSPIPVVHLYWDGRLKLHLKPPGPLPEPNPEVEEGELDPRGLDPNSYTSLDSVHCERVNYIDHDYFGHRRPENEPPTVGPIQDLERLAGGDQEEVIELWPNASPNRPPGKDMRIKIKPRPFRSVKKPGEWVQP